MAIKKKNNSRKALAVALGILGVAGLSLASASQLTVNTNSANIAVGSGTFATACDTDVNVTYTYDLTVTPKIYKTMVISGIAPACDALKLDYTLNTSGTTDPAGTIASIPTGGTVTVVLPAIPLTDSLSTVDIAIY